MISPVLRAAFSVPRRILRLLTLLVVVAGCGREDPPPPAAAFERELASGAAFARGIAARQQSDALTQQEVIAAGYLERLRLGMGSPFRLMEYALRDPRLTVQTRTPLLWALLDETRAGRGYQVDPRALVRISGEARGRDVQVGRMHLELIDWTIRTADDPREGELAVREAYRLAVASHAVAPAAPGLAASAAALVRDRELARRDARRLLAYAEQTMRGEGEAKPARPRHPFALLAEWRAQRRFAVEAPPAAPRSTALELAAAARVPALAQGVAAVQERFLAGARAAGPAKAPGLTPSAGRRLAAVARVEPYPTQAPVWNTVQRYDDELRRTAADDAPAARGVRRLLQRARTEESLAAEHASLAAAPAPVREVLALVALEAAVAMRAYAQESVWFPGFAAPSEADLKRTYGLREVAFDRDVPAAWRPYYRRMLGDALAELEGVLPALDLRGASFRVGTTGREGRALATHDPYGRRIHLPPQSGAGAIAHEVGHDLDWQVALARYGVRAAYGTERALRAGQGDALATAVRRMPVPPELPMRGGAEAQRRYAQHPPEIFARTFDGYVATVLAERGRSNGYLTAAQDEVLGGHGSALMPGARADAAGPFMEMMMVVSPVPEPARRAFLARWGPGRVPDGFEMVRRVVPAASLGRAPAPARRPPPGMEEVVERGGAARAQVAAVASLRDGALAEWAAARCASPFSGWAAQGDGAVLRLLNAAVEARVRGIVLTHARALGLHDAPAWLREVWLGREAQGLGGFPPLDADRAAGSASPACAAPA